MSQFILERVLAPANSEPAQLFIIFAEYKQLQTHADIFITTLARNFPAAAFVIVVPNPQVELSLELQEIIRGSILNDEQLQRYVGLAQIECQAIIQAQQERFKMAPEATAIVAIGQVGSALVELSKSEQTIAGRLFAFGSRFAQLPAKPLSLEQTVHFLHGGQDPVMPAMYTLQTQAVLAKLQGDVTIDVGHTLLDSFNPELIQKMIERLLSCVPLRYWRDAEQIAECSDGEVSPGSNNSIH